MKPIKRIISVLLVVITLLSVFTISTFAEESDEKILVTELSATVVEPIDGETMSFEAISGDTEKYEVEISYWKDTTTNQKWFEEHGKKFIGGHSYTPYVNFYPKEGYYFSYRSSEMSGKINDRNVIKYSVSSGYCQFFLMDNEFFCEIIPDERIPINEINVSVEADIRGLSVKDYKEFITIETEHITFDTSKYENEILISSQDYLNQCQEPNYDPYANEYTGELKGGKYYVITFYMQPEDGYKISEDAIIYINGNQATPITLFVGDSVITGYQVQVYTAWQSFILKIMLAFQNFLDQIAALVNG